MATLDGGRRARLVLCAAIGGFSAWCALLQHTLADSGDVNFEFADQLEVAYFPDSESTDASESSASTPAGDPALEQAAYLHQSRGGVNTRNLRTVYVGYDAGFVIASRCEQDLHVDDRPFLMRLNGWGQLRHTNLNSDGPTTDLNQFQLKRGRLIFSGHAFTPHFAYYVQLDGRSSSGDDIRLLDYYLTYDLGLHSFGLRESTVEFKTGRYKMPFTLARYLSSREFEFSDRSVASTFFDVNRSLGCGFSGERTDCLVPWDWEIAIFNGFVTGGAETGSTGNIDNNFASSGRLFFYPTGEWGRGELADFDWHKTLASRIGLAVANTTVERQGLTEFQSVRVVDSGGTLASLLPAGVSQYMISQYAVDISTKWRGWSTTFEYYFRAIQDFDDPAVPQLFDHGHWVQIGKFIIPGEVELIARWSRIAGNSGTLGVQNESADEVAGGIVRYFREQNAKLTFDFTHLNGAPINSPALDIVPGASGWLFRTQMQFAF